MNGVIFDIQRFSLHDGDGIRTTVFLKGCPLRCKWCHNPESQSVKNQLMFYENKCVKCGKCLDVCNARSTTDKINIVRDNCVLCGKCIDVCPAEANRIAGRTESAEDIIKTVAEDKIFYGDEGGMTLSGGEPSMQSDFTLVLISLAKENGISTVVETCGYGDESFFEKAADLGAVFYFDLKAINSQKHLELCGVKNEKIFSNLSLLFSKKAKVILRLPLIPNVNDSDEDLELMKSFLQKNSGKYIRAEIMKYHNLGISKSNALGEKYELSDKNADAENVERWLEKLDAKNNNVIVS